MISQDDLSQAVPFWELNILARTLWAEARGEGQPGIEAVASVIMNRVAVKSWWGTGIVGVCTAPFQFYCWNGNDPNRVKLLQVDMHDDHFFMCLIVARQAIAGELPDNTNGATSYKVSTLDWPKDWGAEVQPTIVIGHHSFYRLEK